MKFALVEVSLASSNPHLPSSSISALAAARELGATTLVASADPDVYEGQLNHLVDVWVPCDTLSPVSIVSAMRPHRPDALVAFSDLFIPEANEAAARLALRHPSTFGSPAVMRDKAKVRAALDAAGLPNPHWAVIDAAAPGSMPLGYPVVAKPIDGCASWDVRLVQDADELAAAGALHLQRATYGRGVTPRHHLLCEEVLDGPLVSVEGFAADGKVEIWGHTDRTLSDPPFYVETSFAFGPEPLHPDLDSYVRAVVAALDYRFGPFHLEAILTRQGPVLVELNPRLIGAGVHECIDIATGGSSAGEVVRRYLGLGPALPPPSRNSGMQSLLTVEDGTISRLDGLDEAAAMPGVVSVVCSKAVGDSCRVTHSNGDSFGYVLTVGSDRADVRQKAEAAAARISIAVEAP